MRYKNDFILNSEIENNRKNGVLALCLKSLMSLIIAHILSLIALDLFNLSKSLFLMINLVFLGFVFYKMTKMKNISAGLFFVSFLVVLFSIKYYIDYAPDII